MNKRRITEQLLFAWEQARGKLSMPPIESLAPYHFEALWPDCYVLHIFSYAPGMPYEFTHIGSRLNDWFGDAVRTSDDIPFRAHVIDHYKQVIETAQPLLTEGEMPNASGHIIAYRHVMVPIGEEGVVTHIFGGLRAITRE
jgi:hypothetical protein